MATMIGRRVWCSLLGMHQATVIRQLQDCEAYEVMIDGFGKHACGVSSLHMTDADAVRRLEEDEFCARHTREQIERGELSSEGGRE